jgi:hypothetical protein
VPLDALGLFAPKTVALFDGAAVKIGVDGHIFCLQAGPEISKN